MVAKTMAVAKSLDIGTRARALGLTGEQVLTVASILEFEGKLDEDYPKIARVLYNRIADGMPLQLDSTVSYVSGREGDVWTTPEERANPSLYNTYQNPGLPPGPIGSPGEKTIEAALNPAEGTWLYFLATDLETGETTFSNTYAEHVRACKAAFGANANADRTDADRTDAEEAADVVRGARLADLPLAVAGHAPRGVRRAGARLVVRGGRGRRR